MDWSDDDSDWEDWEDLEDVMALEFLMSIQKDDEGDDAPRGQGSRKRKSGHSSGRAIKSSRDMAYDLFTAANLAKQKHYEGRSREPSQPQPSPPPVVEDPFSIGDCMKIINTMSGITYQQVGKAVQLFSQCPHMRQAFICMNEEVRGMWLRSLVE